MSSKGGQTVGYHYKMTFIAGFGRGPINELKAIEIGEKIAWEGPVCTTGPHIINKPDLFGGQDKEGGIQGGFQLLFGADDQILPEAATVITGKPLGSTVIPNVQEAMGGASLAISGLYRPDLRRDCCLNESIPQGMEVQSPENNFRLARKRALVWGEGDNLPGRR